ncbi:CLUMA_CG001111, isoform A [Clunio marinus]|uniref:CLUMA_CG001111, isoform A n=1 Tax=Clunio marinus TaxID=568069 RepID=A0A1J1HIS9_9DIPT|nr:CLUMA_CG001111, isoform A [Clunio marinus]
MNNEINKQSHSRSNATISTWSIKHRRNVTELFIPAKYFKVVMMSNSKSNKLRVYDTTIIVKSHVVKRSYADDCDQENKARCHNLCLLFWVERKRDRHFCINLLGVVIVTQRLLECLNVGIKI